MKFIQSEKKKVKKVLFLKILFRKYKSEIMVGSDQIIIDKFEMEVHLVRNKIEEIFRCESDGNRLIFAAANEHCDGCKMNNLFQLHHTCLTKEVEEAWATYFEHLKGKVDLQKSWKLAQQEVEID